MEILIITCFSILVIIIFISLYIILKISRELSKDNKRLNTILSILKRKEIIDANDMELILG